MTAKYISLFVLIQLVAAVLAIVGIPVCAYLALTHVESAALPVGPWRVGHWRPKWAWIWDNDIDGIYGPGKPRTRWQSFYWTALRNPCNNLRFVKGISQVGRPLWRKTWGPRPGGWDAQAGWNSSGYPVLSAGINIHTF